MDGAESHAAAEQWAGTCQTACAAVEETGRDGGAGGERGTKGAGAPADAGGKAAAGAAGEETCAAPGDGALARASVGRGGDVPGHLGGWVVREGLDGLAADFDFLLVWISEESVKESQFGGG